MLVTGALGQIGAELVSALRERYGTENVVASDIRMPQKGNSGPFEFVDVTVQRQIDVVVRRHDIDTIYHLAAILSAVAEEKPHVAWNVNMGGLYRTLEVARGNRCAVFVPSSIAVRTSSNRQHENLTPSTFAVLYFLNIQRSKELI
ncbi:MAG: NAD-dependent epimerase/dehydratase family protein [Gemmatimonadales bacterium]